MAETGVPGEWLLATGQLPNGTITGRCWLRSPGRIWTETLPFPDDRAMHIAYDSVRAVHVGFGGLSSGGQRLSTTWERSVTGIWTQQNPVTVPPARSNQLMVFDPMRNETVMYGGVGVGGLRSDLHTWNGINWTLRAPATAPGAKADLGYAWDADRGEVVWFGGAPVPFGVSDELWAWNGVDCLNRTPPGVRPGARRFPAFAYKQDERRYFVFGGSNGPANASYGDFWEIDAATLVCLERGATAETPSAGAGVALGWDAYNRELYYAGRNQLGGAGLLAEAYSYQAQWARLRARQAAAPARAAAT